MADDSTEPAFGTGRPFSLGVEEELFLVDPVTGDQANASAPSPSACPSSSGAAAAPVASAARRRSAA